MIPSGHILTELPNTQNILSLFTGIIVDILFCHIFLSTLGLLETQAFQKAESQYLELHCAERAIWHFHFKLY